MRTLLMSVSIVLLTLASQAQTKKERIESAKIAFISTRLNLDESTAAKFWPIYNKYTDDLKAANAERKAATDILESNTASDAEIEKALDAQIAAQQKLVDLHKKYKTEFLRVLTARQLAQLHVIERDFKEKLLERMQNGGPRRPQDGQAPPARRGPRR
ncbi:MAG: hypothetical protein RL660_1287 [Bacteroidota bacterium]|jgi:Spy/CpxP family protein refolding chaperone